MIEYVGSHTLRYQLEAVDSKLETVLSYAVQIDEVLQESHSKGIVYRDV